LTNEMSAPSNILILRLIFINCLTGHEKINLICQKGVFSPIVAPSTLEMSEGGRRREESRACLIDAQRMGQLGIEEGRKEEIRRME
jgi:hypothetical protein